MPSTNQPGKRTFFHQEEIDEVQFGRPRSDRLADQSIDDNQLSAERGRLSAASKRLILIRISGDLIWPSEQFITRSCLLLIQIDDNHYTAIQLIALKTTTLSRPMGARGRALGWHGSAKVAPATPPLALVHLIERRFIFFHEWNSRCPRRLPTRSANLVAENVWNSSVYCIICGLLMGEQVDSKRFWYGFIEKKRDETHKERERPFLCDVTQRFLL